jgi:DNA-binding Lrp family transcriptional regulator
MAEVIGVSEQTVARRYRALHGRGALRVIVQPDGRGYGGQTWFVRLRCQLGSAATLAATIAARPEVSWVSITSGGSEITCVLRTAAADAGRYLFLDRLPRSGMVLDLSACSVMHMHVGGEAEWLAFDDPLSTEQAAQFAAENIAGAPAASPVSIRADDAPLLAELAKDGRASVQALARAIDWPPARVSGRLSELLSSGSVYVETDLAPEQFGFHTSAYVWLTVAPGELYATGEALSKHRETSFAAAVTGAANLMTAVTCRSAEELYNYVTTKIGALPAVRQAEVVPVLHRLKQSGTHLRDGRLVRA